MKKQIAIGALMMMLLGGVNAWVYSHGGDDHPHPEPSMASVVVPGGIGMTKDSQFRLGIRTTLAQSRLATRTHTVRGRVIPHPRLIADVYPPFAGHIVGGNLPLIGQWVKQGATLALIKQPLGAPERLQSKTDHIKFTDLLTQNKWQQDILRQQLQVEQQEAQLNLLNLERLKKIQAIIPKEDIPMAELNYAKAKAQIRKTQTELKIQQSQAQALQLQLRQNRNLSAKNGPGYPALALTAPIAGIITDTKSIRGLKVDPSQRLFEIINPTAFWVEAQINENDLKLLAHLQRSVITIPAYPDEPLTGRFITLDQKVDESTRTVKAIFEVANPYRHLKTGMFAQVRLESPGMTPQLLIPAAALYEKSGNTWVFVHTRAELFEQRNVRLGEWVGHDVVIQSGIKPGERVVIQGAHQIFASRH